MEAGSGQGQVDRRRSGRWLLLRCVRTRRVPPGESSHSYKTDGLVAPRVSLGSRLACLECLAIARRARASERSDKGRGIVSNRANRCVACQVTSWLRYIATNNLARVFGPSEKNSRGQRAVRRDKGPPGSCLSCVFERNGGSTVCGPGRRGVSCACMCV